MLFAWCSFALAATRVMLDDVSLCVRHRHPLLLCLALRDLERFNSQQISSL